MSDITGTSGNDTLNGGSGADIIDGGAGNDRISGGSGSDILNGGSGSDTLNGDSGNDTLVYNLAENAGGARDVYTGGSGIDTVLMQLSQAQWTDPAIRVQLQRYVEFLAAVKTNVQGEVSNGAASDFVFTFASGSTLTVQMMEKLVVAVQNGAGAYVVIDHLQSLVSGQATGSVIEAGGVANGTPGVASATGDLYADDLNAADDSFQAAATGTPSTGGYGTYAVDSHGVWTYVLNNAHAAVQALNVGSPPLVDTFTVFSADGTARVVSITIAGRNDAAVITGTSTGTVVEAGGVANGTAGTPTVSGDLLATDVDNAADAFQAVAPGAATALGYGTYGLSASGVWTYSLNNANPAVQALNVGSAPLTDSFTALSADGTAKTVTITIQGTNDAPVAVADTGSGVEDSIVTGSVAGNDSDVDSGAVLSYSLNAAVAGLSMASNGNYSFDAGNAAYQHLAQGATTNVVANYTVADQFGASSTSTLTITLTGTNDTPIAVLTRHL